MCSAIRRSFPPRRPATARHVNRARRRYYRTIFLGLAAMATLVWAAVDQFGLSWRDMSELLLATLAVTAVVILLAGLSVLLWVGLRRVLRPRREDEP